MEFLLRGPSLGPIILRFAAAIAVVVMATSCVTETPQNCITGIVDPSGECRPFRTHVLTVDREKERLKPLAAYPFGGFSISEDMIIGEMRSQWLGALSLKSQKVKWWYKLPSAVAAPVQVFGSWGLIGLRNGTLLKIDTNEGKKIWEIDLGRFYHREAVLSGQTLLVHTVDNKLFAIDFLRGRKLWVYDAGAPDGLSMRAGAKPVVVDKFVFMGNTKGEVQIVSLENGRLLRRVTLPLGGFRFHDVVGDIVVQQDHVLFAKYDGSVGRVSYNTATPTVKWRQTFPSISATTFREGIYYVGCSNGDLMALDWASGKEKWRIQTGQTVVSIVTTERVLFVTGASGQISAINAVDGSVEWNDDLEGTIADRPIFFGDQLFFVSGLGTLYGYKVR